MTKWTMEDLQTLAFNKNGKCLSNEYSGVDTYYLWQCSQSHTWKAPFYRISKQGTWCPYCQGNARHDLEYLIEFSINKGGMCLSDNYCGMNYKYKWQCEFGHIWNASAANVINRNSWCCVCRNKGVSLQELEIYNYVKNLFPDALNGETKLLKNPKFEIDIYVPSLKKGIEYDGSFWHKESKYARPERDARKNQECIDAGIKLLRINDIDFKKNKQEVFIRIKDFLFASL